jgi:hypothetical protein
MGKGNGFSVQIEQGDFRSELADAGRGRGLHGGTGTSGEGVKYREEKDQGNHRKEAAAHEESFHMKISIFVISTLS